MYIPDIEVGYFCISIIIISEFLSFVFCRFFCISVIKSSRLIVWTMTLVTGKDSCHRHGLKVSTWTHGIDMDSWY